MQPLPLPQVDRAARLRVALDRWAEECGRRGWVPDVERVLTALTALDEAIAQRGGQRRARPYVAHERRRLARI